MGEIFLGEFALAVLNRDNCGRNASSSEEDYVQLVYRVVEECMAAVSAAQEEFMNGVEGEEEEGRGGMPPLKSWCLSRFLRHRWLCLQLLSSGHKPKHGGCWA